jgi:hypothetical protein
MWEIRFYGRPFSAFPPSSPIGMKRISETQLGNQVATRLTPRDRLTPVAESTRNEHRTVNCWKTFRKNEKEALELFIARTILSTTLVALLIIHRYLSQATIVYNNCQSHKIQVPKQYKIGQNGILKIDRLADVEGNEHFGEPQIHPKCG